MVVQDFVKQRLCRPTNLGIRVHVLYRNCRLLGLRQLRHNDGQQHVNFRSLAKTNEIYLRPHYK